MRFLLSLVSQCIDLTSRILQSRCRAGLGHLLMSNVSLFCVISLSMTSLRDSSHQGQCNKGLWWESFSSFILLNSSGDFENHVHVGCTQRERERKPNEDIVQQRRKMLEQLKNYQDGNGLTTPYLDEQNFKKEELETVGELSDVCSQIVLKCLCLSRIERLDILWYKLGRAVLRWTRVCVLSSFDILCSSNE